MEIYFLISILFVFFCIYIWIGKKAADNVKSSNDYFLMGRQLTLFPLAMTLLATMLGGGVLVGAAQAAYDNGWLVIIYPLGTFLGFAALGSGFGARLRQLNINTMPEIFETIYQSQKLRSIAAVFSLLTLFSILVAQGIAIKSFFITVGMTNPIYLYVFWAVFVGYTTMGGFKAVVDTDVIQAIFMLFGLALALFSLSFTQFSSVFDMNQSQFSTNIPWSLWLLMPFCYIFIGQDMGQRCFATKNSNMIAPASFAAGLVLLFCSAIAIIFGLLAKSLGIEIAPGANILITSVKALTSPVVYVLFVGTIIMAITSTADSLLCSISSNICSDFAHVSNLPTKKQLFLSRAVTFCIGVSALFFVTFFNSIINALMFAYELNVSTLFVPIIIGVLVKKPSQAGAFAAILGGFIGFVIFNQYFNLGNLKELSTLVLSLVFYNTGAVISQDSERMVTE